MPLWKIYHPVDAFTADDKKGIAQALTGIYGRVMPKFYVGVVFQEVTEDNFYIGGEPHPRFIRIWVDHIARTFQSDERSEEHTSELQSLMRISYAVFCLKKKKNYHNSIRYLPTTANTQDIATKLHITD